jgi:hypothetical protein
VAKVPFYLSNGSKDLREERLPLASHSSEFQQQKSVKANDHDRNQLLHHLAPSRSTGQVLQTAIIESNASTYIWIIATLREEKSIRVINFQVRRVVHERKSGRARRQKY